MGPITNEIKVALGGFIIVAILLQLHVRAAFCICLVFCSFVWWWDQNSWPTQIVKNCNPPLYNDLGGREIQS